MNKIHRALGIVCIAITTQFISAQEAEINSAAWLQKGCTALVFFNENGQWSSAEESAAGAQVQLWLNGCMVGINSMCFSTDPSPDLTYPPKNWKDGRVIAPMILDFMKKNPKIPPTSRASYIVGAWYLAAHPKATPEHKRLSEVIIEDVVKNPNRRD